jgi:hypothetical protein
MVVLVVPAVVSAALQATVGSTNYVQPVAKTMEC